MRIGRVAACVVLASIGCGGATSPALTTPSPVPSATAAPSPPAPIATAAKWTNEDDGAIAKAERDYVDLLIEVSPQYATELGLHSRDAELDDYAPAGFEANVQKVEAMLDALKKRFAAPHASRTMRTDLELVEHDLAVMARRAREERPLERAPQKYLSPLSAMFAMIARDYAPAHERAKYLVSRMRKIPAVVDAAKANLKRPPRIWTETAIDDAKHAKAFLEQARTFVNTTLSPADRGDSDKVIDAAEKAYTDYAAFLAKDVLPRSDGNYAAGRAYFDFLLAQDYFLDQDADAVLALGKRVFDETDAKMTALAKKIDPKAKGWPEVTARLKGVHPTADDLIPSYRRQMLRARAFLVQKDVVPFPPGDDCEVMETPPFERSTTSAAYDGAPPFDTATNKGFFFVTPVDAKSPPKQQEQVLRENDDADQVNTVVHETYPGHHLQLSFARTNPSLARKATEPSVFAEGWALYSEELLAELGYYSDEERLMQLEWTLVRAARVIIDVGLHTQGMSVDDAMKLLMEKVHLEHELAKSEVRRYTSSPTQPLSYLVGREAIFAIRERYKQREGDKFTLKRFHTEMLSHGTLAPGLLAKEIFEP